MTMQDELKKAAAEAALEYIPQDAVIGVGTGSTVNFFITALQKIKNHIEAAVATSEASAKQLKLLGIPLVELNSLIELPLYIDGADEITSAKKMIKGGGGALTREKIVATMAKKFICIVDETKKVDVLGAFPVPVEVIPMARSFVARQIVKMGGDPVYREGVVTDNGNVILDVHNLKLLEPGKLEEQLKAVVGVIESGIFAKRTADVLLLGKMESVDVM